MDRKITAITVQKNNSDRVNIELDGEFAFGLSRIVAAWLKPGDCLSEEKITSLQSRDGVEVAYQKAIRLLDYRLRTEQEIRQRLIQKEFSSDEIEAVITRLKDAKLIQDQQYANMWAENRSESHPRSQRLIRYELLNKGISKEMIDNALTETASDIELANRAAKKYAQRLAGLDWQDFRKRLSAFLARRGFSYETISPVVQSVWNSMISVESTNLENEDL